MLKLSVEINDPQLEGLISHLGETELPLQEKIHLLERTADWLKKCDPFHYKVKGDLAEVALQSLRKGPSEQVRENLSGTCSEGITSL